MGIRNNGSGWRTVRREALIGLLWGVGVAVLVVPFMVPYVFKSAGGEYRPATGGTPGPEGEPVWTSAGARVYPLTAAEKWAYGAGQGALVTGVCGGIGVAVGLLKAWRRGQLRGGSPGDTETPGG